MKKRFSPNKRISQQALKAKIMKKAREGAFDRIPLLATLHQAICKTCGCANETVYLRYLKSGAFEIGDTQMVEMVFTSLAIPELEHTTEKVTPIIIKFKCGKCGTETVCSPISLEYLMYTATKPPKPESMYV
jgi:hypothetical protein